MSESIKIEARCYGAQYYTITNPEVLKLRDNPQDCLLQRIAILEEKVAELERWQEYDGSQHKEPHYDED